MALMRARDVRDRCKGRVDPQVLYVLEALAEQNHAVMKGAIETAQMVDQLATIVQNFVGVAENMKSAVETMRGATRADDDDLPPVTQ